MPPSARWTMRPIMSGEGGIDKIVARRAAAPAFALVGAGQSAIADDVGDQDRRELPCLAHFEPPQPTRARLAPRRAKYSSSLPAKAGKVLCPPRAGSACMFSQSLHSEARALCAKQRNGRQDGEVRRTHREDLHRVVRSTTSTKLTGTYRTRLDDGRPVVTKLGGGHEPLRLVDARLPAFGRSPGYRRLHPKSAFSRLPPVQRAELERQLRVDLTRSASCQRRAAICALPPFSRAPNV